MSETRETTAGGFFPRLGSVLALAPLGLWVCWHLWENLYAVVGEAAWQERVTDRQHPVAEGLTLLVVFGPLVLHTLWGLRRVAMARPNGYRYFGNARYVLQRLSALGVLLFLVAHVYLARIHPALTEDHPERFGDLAAEMRMPKTLVVYLLGVLGTAYHLANGVQTAAFIHGFTASSRAARRMQWASVVFFLLLLGTGWGAVYGLWRAGAEYEAPQVSLLR
ncbi:MAG: succinate dehydrogenase [Deltaproteobacteria bacterium]|nr:succinate dehydrogenase [Deltaproteobacteria bacterium]